MIILCFQEWILMFLFTIMHTKLFSGLVFVLILICGCFEEMAVWAADICLSPLHSYPLQSLFTLFFHLYMTGFLLPPSFPHTFPLSFFFTIIRESSPYERSSIHNEIYLLHPPKYTRILMRFYFQVCIKLVMDLLLFLITFILRFLPSPKNPCLFPNTSFLPPTPHRLI